MRPEIEAFITRLGVAPMPHSGKTFLAHLRNTAALVQGRGLPQHVVDAAALHAIYGTPYFTPSRVPSRLSVRQLIGNGGERLVWLFCVLDRQGLRTYRPVHVSRLGTREFISREEHAHLLEIAEANQIDNARPSRDLPRYPQARLSLQLDSEFFFYDGLEQIRAFVPTIDGRFASRDMDAPIWIDVLGSSDSWAALTAEAMAAVGSRSLVFGMDGKTTQESQTRVSENLPITPTAEKLLGMMTARVRGHRDIGAHYGFDPSKVVHHGQQLLRYGVGGQFHIHIDNTINTNGVLHTNTPDRHLVGILWPNDDYEGGELVFGNIYSRHTGRRLVVRPRAGMFVVFPASAWYSHGVRPVTSGTRISLTQWWTVA